jgi:hypothetical protein
MKIIHTYFQINGYMKQSICSMMTLSALLAKKNYGNIHLYCDESTADLVKKIGIPYDSIDTNILKNFNGKTFSIPKLLTFAAQTEPYIHIDFDTFIFDKIDFEKYTGRTIYAHKDYSIQTGVGYISLFGFYKTYLNTLYEARDILGKGILENIDVTHIPNMCIFGSFNYELVSKACNEIIDIYENNKEFWDMEFYNACVLEQLLIPTVMKKIDPEYMTDGYNYYYLKEHNIFDIDEENYDDLDIIKFSMGNNVFEYKKSEKTLKLGDRKISGWIHLNGYKVYDIFDKMVEYLLVKEFKDGTQYMNKICEHYGTNIDTEFKIKYKLV